MVSEVSKAGDFYHWPFFWKPLRKIFTVLLFYCYLLKAFCFVVRVFLYEDNFFHTKTRRARRNTKRFMLIYNFPHLFLQQNAVLKFFSKKNWNSTYLFPHRNNHHQKYIFFTRRREGHEGTQNDSCRFITFPHLFLQQNAVLKFFSKKKLKFYLFIPSPEYHHQKYIFFHTKTQRARRNTKRFMPIYNFPHLFLQQNAVLKFFSKKKLKFYLFIPSAR